MKKLIIFLGFIALMAVTFQVNAQSYPVKAITADQVVYFPFTDTLIKDATFNNTYFVKDFAVNARLTLVTDTMTTATDFVKVRAIIGRSANNVDYYSVAGDTVTALATTASGHKMAKSGVLTSIYEPYVKITVKAIDSTQNAKVKFYLLLDKN